MTSIYFIATGRDQRLKHGEDTLINPEKGIWAHWFHPAHLRDKTPVDNQISGHEAVLLITKDRDDLLFSRLITEGRSELIEGIGMFRHNPIEAKRPSGTERRR